MKCGIYKITNIINNKVYIGQSVDIKQRWRSHICSMANGDELLYQAMRKYGEENFVFEILEELPNDEQILDEREQYWIELYHSCIYDPLCNGYNMTRGGWSPKTKFKDEDIDRLWREHKTAKDISNELNLEINTVLRALTRLGYSTHDKQLQYCQEVEQYSLNGEYIATYPSASEAIKQFSDNASSSTINDVCSRRKRSDGSIGISAYGYLWRYKNGTIDIEDMLNYYNAHKRLCCKVNQYTLDGTLINTYDSLADAAIKTNITKSCICRVCKGERKTTHGYIFKYIQ